MASRNNKGRSRRSVAVSVLAAGVLAVAGHGAEPDRRAAAGDDATFRPTVIVRKGSGQGSGTIIGSVDGETLVLTAAHVVRGSGALAIELHRYNLGVEHALPPGGWPLKLPAEVAATDPAADVAVVRVRGRPAFPFVARIAAVGDEPVGGSVVTSVGIDRGERLRSWSTHVRAVFWFAMSPGAAAESEFLMAKVKVPGGAKADRSGDRDDPDAGARPFLITAKAPDHGRSGGGLFREDGRLVGVCVGRIERDRRPSLGVFASGENVHRLLREHDLDALLARPAARPSRPNPKAKTAKAGR